MTASLSQEEIDALIVAGSAGAPGAPAAGLGPEERDAIGEVGNICMSSAATALSALLGHPVSITTPQVDTVTHDEVRRRHARPSAVVSIDYTQGLSGRNVFIISTEDASIVADLMMGGPGTASAELSEIGASALAEAMNQMMGSASTAMAEMLGERVDISAPDVQLLDLTSDDVAIGLDAESPLVRTAFELRVGELLSTTLMQLMPIDFARGLVENLLAPRQAAAAAAPAEPASGAAREPEPHLRAVPAAEAPVARPVTFPELEDPRPSPAAGDIGLLLDVPLRVTVELGRTQLRIRNVLELVPGSIIELDKLAGEPVDVLVNGKQIARGEVVVIDEEFGVRITEVASPARRLGGLAQAE
jgi:flagellar motor switch protein FliN